MTITSNEECPLCLDKLPPIWERGVNSAIGRLPCCGKLLCADCVTEKQKYVNREASNIHSKNSTEKKQLVQLVMNCPLCRTAIGNKKEKEELLLRHSEEGKGWADWSLHWHFGNRNPKLSGDYLKLSAERGYPCALYSMSGWYLGGKTELGIEDSIPESKKALERAAEVGHAKARFDLHWHYIEEKHGGYCKEGEADVDQAIQILELAGEEGYGKAYAFLGDIFQQGRFGKEQNYSTAIEYFLKGTKLNDLKSWYGMGYCHHDLEQIKEETFEYRKSAYDVALMCFQAAAKQGHMPSMEMASSMLTRLGPAHPEAFVNGIVMAQIAMNDGSKWGKDLLQSDKFKNVWSGICFHCHAVAKGGESRFHSCSKCQIAHYCSKQCQKDAWPHHKKLCGKNKNLFPNKSGA